MKGNRFSYGRRRGSKNKFTDLKVAFLEAFEELGGARGLVEWAKKNDRTKGQFYQIIAKMLPSKADEEFLRNPADEFSEELTDFFIEFGLPTVDEFIAMLREVAERRKAELAT